MQPLLLRCPVHALRHFTNSPRLRHPAGTPLELVRPEALRLKAMEPLLLLGKARTGNLDIRIRVNGGGHVSQIYAIRQAIAKAVVAFYQKYVDESSKAEVKVRPQAACGRSFEFEIVTSLHACVCLAWRRSDAAGRWHLAKFDALGRIAIRENA